MTLPPTLDAKGLSRLLYRAEATIIRDVTRRPKTLPPFVKCGKKVIWVTLVVLDWMEKRLSCPADVDLKSIILSRSEAIPPSLPSFGGILGLGFDTEGGEK